MKTPDNVLIAALRILVDDISSEDGVANACIAEAADRLEELVADNEKLSAAIIKMKDAI
jgi:hypothetical protein